MKKFNRKKTTSFSLLFTLLFSFIYWVFITTKTQSIPSPQQIIPNSQTLEIFGNAKVIDGDSIKINKNNIRLLFIDAPEIKQKCLDKNYFEYLCGEVSANFLRKMADNKNVSCSYKEKDIYGRYLGECRLGNLSLNNEIIKNGMAIIYNLKNVSQELINFENEAKNKKLGIWQGAFQEPKEYRKKNRNKFNTK